MQSRTTTETVLQLNYIYARMVNNHKCVSARLTCRTGMTTRGQRKGEAMYV